MALHHRRVDSSVDPIAATREWIERFVVGLGLCPFAAGPLAASRVRFISSGARTPEALLEDLREALLFLAGADPAQVETLLLIHPGALLDFDAFNQFLDAADGLVAELDLEGVLQIASFHPGYVFADAPTDDVANATNRSPHPMLHLLREESVARARAEHPDTEGIPARNVKLLRELGRAEVRARGGRA
jgi:hypothetical protein